MYQTPTVLEVYECQGMSAIVILTNDCDARLLTARVKLDSDAINDTVLEKSINKADRERLQFVDTSPSTLQHLPGAFLAARIQRFFVFVQYKHGHS